MKKVVLSLFFVFLLMGGLFAGGLFAEDCNHHMTQSPDGKGDLLVYPVFFSADGYVSRVWITNTNDNLSVVYKMVVFSPKKSIEMKDFLVFLSPHDVAYFDLVYDGKGVKVTTDDDSICDPDDGNVCGEDFSNMLGYLQKPECEETEVYGYIVGFQAAAFDLPKDPDTGKVDKFDIVEAYKNWDGDIDNVHRNTDVVGRMEIFSNQGTFYGVYDAYAFRNFDLGKYDLGNLTNFFTVLSQPNASHTIAEVEAVMAKKEVYFANTDPKENIISILTFPTKEIAKCDEGEAPKGLFFLVNGDADNDYGVQYNFISYDTTEGTLQTVGCKVSPCPKTEANEFPDEVNFLFEGPFEKGYNVVRFDQTTTGANKAGDNVTYEGAPVLPLNLIINSNGSVGFVKPAFSHGNVKCGNNVIPYYYYCTPNEGVH